MGKFTGMTSFPIPSAGMRPILRVCLAAMEKGLKGTLNMVGDRLQWCTLGLGAEKN